MALDNESFNKQLYDLLKVRGYNPVPKNSKNQDVDASQLADVIEFQFIKDGENYGKAWASIDDAKNVIIYYDEAQADSPEGNTPGLDYDDSWSGFLKHVKTWAQRKQLSFELLNKDRLNDAMKQREYVKMKENLREGYYPMGKQASYSDAVPTVKIILQHSRQIQEGEQRYRNIAKIFLENAEGERILAPTTRPGIAQVYARHLAEGGLPNDQRWNHIKGLCEEYQKMAGFVRATRNGQFNESAQQLVNEGINHYNKLRESLGKLRGHKGYNAYFESWTPALMEDEAEDSTLNELFVQEQMDPRIESAMPILSRLRKHIGEMTEVNSLSEWADGIINEKLDLQLGEGKYYSHKDLLKYADKKLQGWNKTSFDDGDGYTTVQYHHPETDFAMQITTSPADKYWTNWGIGSIVRQGKHKGKFWADESGNDSNEDVKDHINLAVRELKDYLNAKDDINEKLDLQLETDSNIRYIMHKGKKIGEIGIDSDADPGVGGKWYAKHYASGEDLSGFASPKEAKREVLGIHQYYSYGDEKLDEEEYSDPKYTHKDLINFADKRLKGWVKKSFDAGEGYTTFQYHHPESNFAVHITVSPADKYWTNWALGSISPKSGKFMADESGNDGNSHVKDHINLAVRELKKYLNSKNQVDEMSGDKAKKPSTEKDVAKNVAKTRAERDYHASKLEPDAWKYGAFGQRNAEITKKLHSKADKEYGKALDDIKKTPVAKFIKGRKGDGKVRTDESAKQVSEISDKTKLSYVAKANKNIKQLYGKKGMLNKDIHTWHWNMPDDEREELNKKNAEIDKKVANRKKGIERATGEVNEVSTGKKMAVAYRAGKRYVDARNMDAYFDKIGANNLRDADVTDKQKQIDTIRRSGPLGKLASVAGAVKQTYMKEDGKEGMLFAVYVSHPKKTDGEQERKVIRVTGTDDMRAGGAHAQNHFTQQGFKVHKVQQIQESKQGKVDHDHYRKMQQKQTKAAQKADKQSSKKISENRNHPMTVEELHDAAKQLFKGWKQELKHNSREGYSVTEYYNPKTNISFVVKHEYPESGDGKYADYYDQYNRTFCEWSLGYRDRAGNHVSEESRGTSNADALSAMHKAVFKNEKMLSAIGNSELNEISRDLAVNYSQKAADDMSDREYGVLRSRPDKERKIANREKGRDLAMKKLGWGNAKVRATLESMLSEGSDTPLIDMEDYLEKKKELQYLLKHPEASSPKFRQMIQQRLGRLEQQKKELMSTGLNEGMGEADMIVQDIISGEQDAYTVMSSPTTPEEEYVAKILQKEYNDVASETGLNPDDDLEEILDIVIERLSDKYNHGAINEVDMGQADRTLRQTQRGDDYKMSHGMALNKAANRMGYDHYMDVPDDEEDELQALAKKIRSGEVEEGLDANQKRAGQLGPTEKVGPKGAVGKLVGANESVEHDPLDDIKRLLGK